MPSRLVARQSSSYFLIVHLASNVCSVFRHERRLKHTKRTLGCGEFDRKGGADFADDLQARIANLSLLHHHGVARDLAEASLLFGSAEGLV